MLAGDRVVKWRGWRAREGRKGAFGSGHNDDNDDDVEANLTKRAAVSYQMGFASPHRREFQRLQEELWGDNLQRSFV